MPLIRAATAAVAVLVLASWALLAVVHVDDDFLVTHVSGAWMALAAYVNDGLLYPPLYDGDRYGGTRYMPLQMSLHAGAAHVTGEYLVSGKLLGYLLAALLVGLVVFVLRTHLDVPLWLAGGLVATVLCTSVGQVDTLGIGGDGLPVVLQLAAVAIMSRRVHRRSAFAAALLSALAVLAKVTAVWAILAISLWLLRRHRRLLAEYLVTVAILLGATLALVELGTDGRFGENVVGLSTSAVHGPAAALVEAPQKFLSLLNHDAAATWILVPFAAAGFAVAAIRGRLGIYHLSLAFATLTTVAIMADVGTEENHLLDVAVLTILVVGSDWPTHAVPEHRSIVLAALVPLAIVWGTATAYLDDGMWVETKAAARAAVADAPPDGYGAQALSAHIRPDDNLLSEDPGLPVSLGRLPTILDSFMLLRIVRAHPQWGDRLIERLDRREFDQVVLIRRPGGGRLDPSDDEWRTFHFGPAIVAAIARNYRPAKVVRGYRIYLPRRPLAGE